MTTIWILLVTGGLLFGIWHDRKIAESAKEHASRQCDKLNVQLLSVARIKRRIAILNNGKPGFKTEFSFEFSSTGQDSYTGILYLQDIRLVKADIPPHKI